MRLIQSGPRDAKIMIVGEAPGTQEAIYSQPFVGGGGQLLDKMLSRAGLDRANIFVTNVCHTQSPKNDFNWFLKPQPRPEFMMGVMQLQKDIKEIKPNLIIALGANPLRILTGKQGIDKWRGSILECTLVPGVKVISTYHPSYVMRVYDYKVVSEFDFVRCKRESAFPEIVRPKRELILNPGESTYEFWVEQLTKAEWLSLDIECFETPSGWRLACIGFSDHAGRAVVFPWTAAAESMIKRICEAPNKKVMQNGTFDSTVLADHGIFVKNFAWDTMIAHHALYPECASGGDEMSSMSGKKRQAALAKGLGFQTSLYTDEPYYKDDGKLWKETNDLEMFWRYNALDAAVTREIRDVQERELNEFGTNEVFLQGMALVAPLMLATMRGIKIDLVMRDKLRTKYEGEIKNLQSFLDKVAGGSLNVKSPKQVTTFLYDTLKLPPKRNKDSGNLTADKDAIVWLAERNSNPALHAILQIRQRRDFIERYLDAAVDKDGRMRCSFDITGTRSGRLSSRRSIYGSGTNLQNIPSRRPEGEAIRRMFVSDPGKVFVYRDFSQAEARVVAYLAEAQGLIDLFEDPNRDIHTENASRIFGVPIESVTPEQRYLAKRVVHACNYGMEAKRLVEIVNEDAEVTGVRIDFKKAQSLIDRYFMLYPEIRETFWREVAQEIRYSRTLNTSFGRKRTFFGRWDDMLMREAYSYVPQSTVGDLGRVAIINVDRFCRTIPGAEFLLNVHDSILVQCNIGDVLTVANGMEEAMRISMTIKGRKFYIPTDCKVGYNWGGRPKKEPEQNPQGLVDISKWEAA